MKFLLSCLLTPLFHLYYGLILVVFHPIQMATKSIGGDTARRKSVDILNYLLVKGLYIMGCRVRFKGFENLPDDRPVVIVSNHQSLYDIPAIGHGFKKYCPKFISKAELGKNLPSISYNLKHGQSALIDRSNGSQAVKEIFKLGRLIEKNKYAACIFPEGTRNPKGEVQEFMSAGINTLLRAAPSSIIIPFAINGHSRLQRKGMFPLQFGQTITYTALEPIEPKGMPIEELTLNLRNSIAETIEDKK